MGTCPNQEYRLTINTVNSRGVPMAVEIYDQYGELLGITNDNGTLIAYVPVGTYKLDAKMLDFAAKDTVKVSKATKVKLIMKQVVPGGNTGNGSYAPGSGIGGILGDVNSEDYIDRGTVTATGKCGKTAYWDLYSDGTLLIHGTGEVDTSAVRTWYTHRSAITNLIVAEGIENIQVAVFHELKYLKTVEIAGSVGSIPYASFVNMATIETVKLGEGITSIGEHAFSSCYGLKEITLPDSITRIEDYAFTACKALERLDLPDHLDSIGFDAFRDCAGLTKLEIPDTVSNIGIRAFGSCKNLTKLIFGNGNVTVGRDAFSNCTQLTEINFGKGSIDFGANAFQYCGLTKLTVEGGNLTFGEAAFSSCKNLTNVTFGKGVTAIAPKMFNMCEKLTDVTIGGNVTTIGDQAFYFCRNLSKLTIGENVTSIGAEAFYYAGGDVGTLNVSIPGSVTSIGTGAFNHSGVQNVVIEAQLTELPVSMFENCYSLTEVKLPESLQTIGEAAFESCHKLQKVDIPMGVTTIGESAFRSCPVTELVIPNSVVSIGEKAFSCAGRLPQIVIPASATDIAPGAFAGCGGLESFRVDAENPCYSSDDAGALLSKDGTVLIQVPGMMRGTYVIPEGVTTIADNAVSSCRYLTGIEIPDSVTSIGDSAFIACQELTKITLPAGVTHIGAYAFKNCVKLTGITIPDGVQEIKDETFYGCTALTEVNFGAGLTTIGEYAFRDCARISRLVFPANVSKIGNYAFNSARNLKSIAFMGDAPLVGTKAFQVSGVVKANAYYPAGNETWTEDVMAAFGNNIVWHAYAQDENGDWFVVDSAAVMTIAEDFAEEENTQPPADTEPATAETSGEDAGVLYTIYPGDSETEKVEGRVMKTVSFTGLVPGEDYILLALASLDAENPLAESNLLYITQAPAKNDGTLNFRYVQPSDVKSAYVMACGPSNKNLANAVIIFPQVYADGEAQCINPIVRYNDKVLTEGVDYKITGDTCFVDAGLYSCTIIGIYQYSGSVTCEYVVDADDCNHTGGAATCLARAVCDLCGRRYGEVNADAHAFENGTCTICGEKDTNRILGDIDGNGAVDVDDVLTLLWYVLFPEDYPIDAEVDFDHNGSTDVDDVLTLLWYVLFPEDYPL